MMPGPIPSRSEIQQKLDDWLASEPEAQKYVTKIWYLPDDMATPPLVSHLVRLSAQSDEDLDLRLGVQATVETAKMVNALLGLLDADASKRKK
jgi:hypothetical protein